MTYCNSAPSTDKVRTSLKNSSQEVAGQIELKRNQIPSADQHVPIERDTEGYELLEIVLTKQKRRRGRPRRGEPDKEKNKRKEHVQLSERERELVKADLHDGKSVRSLALKYHVSPGTVSNIAKETKPPGKRGGHVYEKITPAASVVMTQQILEDPLTSACVLKETLGKMDIHVAESTINHHLNSSRMEEHQCPIFSVKRLRVHEEARASDATKHARVEYVERFVQAQADGRMFIYIDETSFNMFEFRKMGRSPLGTRCIVRRRRVKAQSLTAITAICEYTGILHVTFVDGTVDNAVFQLFLLSLIEKLQTFTHESCVFVMDNVALHKTDEVKALMTEKNYSQLFTAPNSC